MEDWERMKAEGIIFDKDGTLIDFDAFWVPVSAAAVKAVLQQLRQEEALLGEMLEAFGVQVGQTDIDSVLCKGTYAQMAQIVHGILQRQGCDLSPEELEKCIREAYDCNAHAGQVQAACPNLREVLMTLRGQGRKLAVITTDTRPVTLFCLEKLGIVDLFDKIYTDDGEIPTKPHPDSAFDLCRTFGLNRENVIMVGDTMTDVLFARNAGLGMVGVAKTEKNKALLRRETETVLHDISELLNIL